MATITDDDVKRIWIIWTIVMASQVPENNLFAMLNKSLNLVQFVNKPQISLDSSHLKAVAMATIVDNDLKRILIFWTVVMDSQVPENILSKTLDKLLKPITFVNNPKIPLDSRLLKAVTMATIIDDNLTRISISCKVLMASQVPENNLFEMLNKILDPV